MDQRFLFKAVTAGVILALAGCGGGGDSTSSTGTTVRAYTLPTEISAVPASTSAAASLSRSSLLGHLDRAASTLSSTSDYKMALTSRYVEEHALEQFDIIEQVMSALAQTNYNDPANQNGVAYKAMIAWEEENNGVSTKKLEPWVVESSIVSGTHPNGSTGNLNKVQVWIEEDDTSPGAAPGAKRTIRAEFKIYTGATFGADGSVLTYGEWDLNVAFDDTATTFFVATSRNNNGNPELKINMDEGEWFSRAVLYRSGSSGYGKVEYPDYSSCMSWPCTPGTASASYAYNADYLAVDDGSGAVYKDRNSEVEMTHRYGLFYTETPPAGVTAGDNVQKHKSFGFPVSYDDNGVKQHAYYGAWQGRHQLWGPNGGAVPTSINGVPTILTREDFGANSSPATYTVSEPVTGTFTKRTYVDGSLSDIQDVPFETWVNKHMEMKWNQGQTQWQSCAGWWDYSTPPAVCRDFQGNPLALTAFTDLASLEVSATDRRFVNLIRFANPAPVNYVYLTAAPSGFGNFTIAGFYPAVQGQNGGWGVDPAGTLYTPADGDQMVVDIGGSIYIEFNSTAQAWKQKKLLSFDQQTWTPTFDPNGDTNFTPDLGREYYINAKGVNYVVKRVGNTGTPAADNQVKLELQTTANPTTVVSILPAGTAYLASPWDKAVTFKLETNSASANFMKLVYLTDPKNSSNVGQVLSQGQWGLQAFNSSHTPLAADGSVVTVDANGLPSGAVRPAEFNWEYSANGGWGTQQYLMSGSSYVLLDDPIMLNAQGFTTNAGQTKTLMLQYDGWMHGMPDLYRDLEQNGWSMTQALSDKIINIPAGTEVVDTNGVHYYIKPLEISVFLAEIAQPAGAPDVTQGSALDVGVGSTLLPIFTDHGMSTTVPSPAEVKYSEGNPV